MKLLPENIITIVDSREQAPFDLSPMGMERGTLPTGDYSVRGLEDLVCVERKELGDLISCIGPGRERFERELQRMRGYPHRAVLVEASWADLETGNYRSQLNPKSACHSVISWTARWGIPFHFAGDREAAERWTRYFLYSSAKRIWERAEVFSKELMTDE